MNKISVQELLRPSVIALVLANLAPVYGVLFLGWQVFPIVLLFWVENVIVGALNVLRMLVASPNDLGKWLAKLLLIPFFCFHYGMFTMVHGMIALAIFGDPAMKSKTSFSPELFLQIVREQRLEWAVLGLALSHLVSFALNYLWRGEYRTANLEMLMARPYGRVVVLHLTILGGGFLVMALHAPVMGLLVLLLLKIGLDVCAHLGERQKLGGVTGGKAPAAIF
ncbi:MAG: hypothetical protein HYV36_06135 [Lentisphaerae bacterium]|nr:hypothetical protein [Lentisphaerota bacterium]